jgi:hypothetical protein
MLVNPMHLRINSIVIKNDESRVILSQPRLSQIAVYSKMAADVQTPANKRAAHEQIRDPKALCSLHIVNPPVGSADSYLLRRVTSKTLDSETNHVSSWK